MARAKKGIDYKKLSIEEFNAQFELKVAEIEEMLKVADSFQLGIKKAAPTLTKLGIQRGYDPAFEMNSTQEFSNYTRTQPVTQQPQIQSQIKNPLDVEELDLIVTPLDPMAPSVDTYKGMQVAPLADQGFAVTQQPASQLEAIEKTIKSRLLELGDEDVDKNLDDNI